MPTTPRQRRTLRKYRPPPRLRPKPSSPEALSGAPRPVRDRQHPRKASHTPLDILTEKVLGTLSPRRRCAGLKLLCRCAGGQRCQSSHAVPEAVGKSGRNGARRRGDGGNKHSVTTGLVRSAVRARAAAPVLGRFLRCDSAHRVERLERPPRVGKLWGRSAAGIPVATGRFAPSGTANNGARTRQRRGGCLGSGHVSQVIGRW
jgi:hypothetical protein